MASRRRTGRPASHHPVRSRSTGSVVMGRPGWAMQGNEQVGNGVTLMSPCSRRDRRSGCRRSGRRPRVDPRAERPRRARCRPSPRSAQARSAGRSELVIRPVARGRQLDCCQPRSPGRGRDVRRAGPDKRRGESQPGARPRLRTAKVISATVSSVPGRRCSCRSRGRRCGHRPGPGPG